MGVVFDKFERWTCWHCEHYKRIDPSYCKILEIVTKSFTIDCVCKGKLFEGEKYYLDQYHYYHSNFNFSSSKIIGITLMIIGSIGAITSFILWLLIK